MLLAFCSATDRRSSSSLSAGARVGGSFRCGRRGAVAHAYPAAVRPRRQRLGGHRGALDPRANLGERGRAGGGGIVGERREPAIVGGPELIDRDIACRFK